MSFISPMLLHKADEPFNDSNYLTELKLDGIRFIYTVDDQGRVRMYSRHNNDITSKFPELKDLGVPPGITLDGELIVTDRDGKPDFEAMMSRFQSGANGTQPVNFVAFDVIQHKGDRVTGLPLLNRKEILADLIPTDSPLLAKSQFLEGHGAAYFEAARAQSLEGVVLKRKDSKYQIAKRSHDWLKVINYQFADVFITGYRKKEFGWVLADKNNGYLGIMELGVPAAEKKRIYQSKVISETDTVKYIDPVPVRVKFRNYTKSGLLRLPSFVSW